VCALMCLFGYPTCLVVYLFKWMSVSPIEAFHYFDFTTE